MDDQASGTVAGLLEFLDRASGEARLHPSTIQAMRSAWHSVTQELGISSARHVRELKPDAMIDAFEERRGPNFRSGATYRTRLRVGQQLYLAWLAGDPDWTQIARRRGNTWTRGLNSSDTGHRDVRIVEFPLRRGLVISIELPRYLSTAEAERICRFLNSLAIPPDGEPPRSPAEGQTT